MKSHLQHKDSLFAQPLGAVSEFRFDQSVADVFPDMLRRSIPGYQAIISQSGLLAARYAQAHTHLYDLGCSLGATSLAMREAIADARTTQSDHAKDCTIIGIDNSTAMIAKATKVVSEHELALAGNTGNTGSTNTVPVELHCANMQEHDMTNASVVAMNFTLQFIPPAERDDMIQRIANSLLPGGVLIVSEKVTFTDPVLSEMHIDMYHNFKRANGYSDLEISQKRTALENVLIPDTLDTHEQRFKSAGFSSSSVWFQCFNFASIIAIK